MMAEILSTGDEVRSGVVLDSNSAHIAQTLEAWGLEVVRHSCVGDDLNVLIAVLKEIGNRADLAIVTGGLGPTADDLTAEAAAKAAGVEMVLDQEALGVVENYFRARKRLMTPSNKKQALLPKGAECLCNPVGTAPGFFMKIGKCFFFFLPGVPSEMRRMLSEEVLPRIEKLQGGRKGVSLVKVLSTFGLTESATGELLADLTAEFPGIKLGFRIKFPEIHIRLYGRGEDEKTVRELLENASAWALRKIGKRAFSADGSSMEIVVGDLLRRQGATLAVAESCTGGLISHWLTNVPGSSGYFLFSGVVYSNEAKIKTLGVSPATVAQYGAVHEETVKEMAEGARRIAGATYGLSTSGIAGPDGGTEDKPVGTVCVGLASCESVEARRFYFPFADRLWNKKIFAMTALDMLRRRLAGLTEGL